MGIENVLTLIGGLSLFLLGMNSMGDGLERACGNKMKKILEKLTANRFIGVIVGMGITMVIQSSSATTVMVVGFVNAGMMTLTQAVWIIMGANIGTTITGQLVALDMGFIAPVFAIIGIIMMLFIKKPIINEIGKIFCGFGILFIGMDMMSSSMMPLRESEQFVGLMTKFSNPFLGIFVGAIFTAVIQSSSASVGILQALAISGVIELKSAVYVLFGQNIGTCITALLASIGTNRSAKRTTLIHFMFNIIGTIVFTIICFFTPLVDFIQNLTPTAPAQQIANMHTLFNIATTLLLLPFGVYLVKLAEKILPDKPITKESLFMYLNNDMNVTLGGSAIHLQNTKLELTRMYQLALQNINYSFDCLIEKNKSKNHNIIETEDLIDNLHKGITLEITNCLSNEHALNVSNAYSAYLDMSTNIERLSDHAMNLYEQALEIMNKKINLSEEVYSELNHMKEVCNEMSDIAFSKDIDTSIALEDLIDHLTDEYKNNMYSRLQALKCSGEGSIIYSAILINFERIGDHLLNIAEDYQNI